MKVIQIGIFETKTRLSELIQQVEQGQVFHITRRGKKVAELRPPPVECLQLSKGCAANDEYWMADDFDDTPEEFDDYV